MAPKRVVTFLLSVVPIFLALLWLWQSQGVDRFYHSVVATLLDRTYPPVSPAGVVRGVDTDTDEFVVHLRVNGRHPALYVNAQDITWNVAMMIALYLASASWHRRFWLWFGSAAAILMAIHSITVVTFVREALLSNPETARLAPMSAAGVWLVVHYNRFYEELGVHLVVLALWLPYVMTLLHPRVNASRQGHGHND